MVRTPDRSPSESTPFAKSVFKSQQNYADVNKKEKEHGYVDSDDGGGGDDDDDDGDEVPEDRPVINDKENTGTTTAKTQDKLTENENETKEIKHLEIFNTFRGSKTIVLILCSFSMFATTSACALIAPFYPKEAKEKGLSLTLIGLIFSVYQFLVFALSPVIGTYMTRIGIKFVLLSGIFVGGSCNILFGVLEFDPNGTSFAIMSLLCRSLEAVGMASFRNACMALAASLFQEQVGRVTAVLQTSSSIGFIVAPMIGGCLYDLGGFGLPFYVVGCCVLVSGVLLYALLPEAHEIKQDGDDKRRGGGGAKGGERREACEEEGGGGEGGGRAGGGVGGGGGERGDGEYSIFGLVRRPAIAMPMFSVFLGSSGIVMFDSLYVTHLESFHLSASAIGGMYTIGGVTFAMLAPFWGYISDARDYLQIPILILGQVLFGLGFLANGPSRSLLPFVPFNLLTNSLSYALIGVSLAILTITGMKCMVKGAYEAGYGKDLDTYAMVSGLYNSGFSCGGFCGPLAGGAIVQRFGFSDGFTAFGLLNISWAIVLVVYFSIRYAKGRRVVR